MECVHVTMNLPHQILLIHHGMDLLPLLLYIIYAVLPCFFIHEFLLSQFRVGRGLSDMFGKLVCFRPATIPSKFLLRTVFITS